MPSRTDTYNFVTLNPRDVAFWDYEKINWQSVENELQELYSFIGSGINDTTPPSRWAITTVSGQPLQVSVSAGDGIVGTWAAYTPAAIIFDLQAPTPPATALTYYCYVTSCSALPTKHRAQIVCNTDPIFDSTNVAAFLGSIIVLHVDGNPGGDDFVYRIDYGLRRQNLRDLQGPAMDVINGLFLHHVHSGVSDQPSKIVLGSQVLDTLSVYPGSTIFLLHENFLLPADLPTLTDSSGTPLLFSSSDPTVKTLTSEAAPFPLYVSVNVLLDGVILGASDYYLDNRNGRVYLKNDIPVGDLLQVIKTLDLSQTQIARGPQDDPGSTLSISDPIAAAKIWPRYQLPASRVQGLDASGFMTGTFPISRIMPIDHFGMSRVREAAVISPSTPTRTRDRQLYYLVPPNTPMGFDTEIVYATTSAILGSVVSIASGLYKVTGEDWFGGLTPTGWDADDGLVIQVVDNLVEGVHGGENRFDEVYALSSFGVVWVSYDEGTTWATINLPMEEGLVVNSLTVSTDVVQVEINYEISHDYYKCYSVATNHGHYSARVLGAKGLVDGSSQLQYIELIPWGSRNSTIGDVPLEILSEIITVRTTVDGSGNSTTSYDRTLYAGGPSGSWWIDSSGNATLIDSTYGIKDILWMSGSNGLCAITGSQILVTHTAVAVHVDTDDGGTEDYFSHPLTGGSQDWELSHDLSYDGGRTANRLVEDTSRSVFLVGLDQGVAISSPDQQSLPPTWDPLTWTLPTTNMVNVRQILPFITASNVFNPIGAGTVAPPDYTAATDFGPWRSVDGGNSWHLPMTIWNPDIVPVVYEDGVSAINYSLVQAQQAILFNSVQPIDAIVAVEKDFLTYFAVNGGWEGSPDLVVYENGNPITVAFTVDQVAGSFTFALPRSPSSLITFTLVDRGRYLSNVGTTPHQEILSSFDPDPSVTTTISSSSPLLGGVQTIKVASTSGFPASGFIEIDMGLPNMELIAVTVTDGFTFSAVSGRPMIVHNSGAMVTKVSVDGLLGIEDEASLSLSGQSFFMNSVVISNLLRLQSFWKGQEPTVFDPSTPSPGQTKGLLQQQIHLSGDAVDPAASSSTLWTGLTVTPSQAPAAPRIVSAMMGPGTNSFIAGTERGIWEWDGSKWTQLSTLDDAGFVYYLSHDHNGNLIAGADNGLWSSSDSGTTWTRSVTYFQQQLSFITGSLGWYSGGKPFELYGKNDGVALVVFDWDGVNASSFCSDHFGSVDGERTYGVFQGTFFRIDPNTFQKSTLDSLWLLSEVGPFVCYSGSQGPYSALLNGRIGLDPGAATDPTDHSHDQSFIESGYDSAGTLLYEKLKFFQMFQDLSPNSVPIICLTSDGIRVARNWRWVDPIPASGDTPLYLFWEATPLTISPLPGESPDSVHARRIVCTCYATGSDLTASPPFQYKIFVGTSQGLFRSYDGCHTVQPCEAIPGASSIYSLVYSSGVLFAGTDQGYWTSANDGDDWVQPTMEMGNAIYPNGYQVAQTFTPTGTTVTKVSLYLHAKPVPTVGVGSNPFLPPSFYGLHVEIQALDGSGNPTGTPLVTSESISSDSVIADGFCGFVLGTPFTLPDSDVLYAVVLVEEGQSPGFSSAVGWVKTNGNLYAGGQRLVQVYGGWTAVPDEDQYFRVYFDAAQTPTVVPTTYSFSQVNADRFFVRADGTVILDLRFMFSWCFDSTGSAPAYGNPDPRTAEALSFANSVSARATCYGDVWVFDASTRENTGNGPDLLTGNPSDVGEADFTAALAAVGTEVGTSSPLWDAADQAVGNLNPSSLISALVLDGQQAAVVTAMDSSGWIDYASLTEIDASYAGGGLSEVLKNGNLMGYLLEIYAETFARRAFIISDGYSDATDVSSPTFVALAANGIMGQNMTPVHCIAVGKNYDVSGMDLVASQTGGTVDLVGPDLSSMAECYAPLLDQTDRQDTIFQGIYQDEVWFSGPTFLKQVTLDATVPGDSALTLEMSFSFDGLVFAPWQDVPINEDVPLGLFVDAMKFRIRGWQGGVGSEYAIPLINSLIYQTVTPSETFEFTEPLPVSSILQYELSPELSLPPTADIEWGIVRGASTDWGDAEAAGTDVKGVLPNRQWEVFFTPEVDQLGLSTVKIDTTGFIFKVVDSTGATVTWDSSAKITVFVNSFPQDILATPYSLNGALGYLWFHAARATTDVITVDVIVPGQLETRAGELALSSNLRTYYAKNGEWPADATAIVRVNGSVVSGGYVAYPSDGAIFFLKERESTDTVTIEIDHAEQYRLAWHTTNYGDSPIDSPTFGFVYSQQPSPGTLLKVRQATPPYIEGSLVYLCPMGWESQISSSASSISISADDSLMVEYQFEQDDGNAESGTEIRWFYIRGANPPAELTAYEGRNVQRMSDIASAEGSPFQSGDTWWVTVVPHDSSGGVGLTYTSNVCHIGAYVNPYIIRAAGGDIVGVTTPLTTDTNGNLVSSVQPLRANYSFVEPNLSPEDYAGANGSTVSWFRGGATAVQWPLKAGDDQTTLPTSLQAVGDSWFYVAVPKSIISGLTGPEFISTDVTITAKGV